ncbi:hypothetical protein [Clostridium botulinum]|uniref:hypothetical protein n=1 Tax=Clostridium botulinum TaxID=1491 RepID=UPI0004D5C692|nr:hypothetical protein [Clostridium botulinum]KEH99728.1 hypothetical protein Z952_p0052 [Clostridium botulinum C/D str. BKT75002]KEI05206.1 DNA methylase [Clostridium botulinum C/D str. BKT2873]QPW62099.1 hypothetical protein IG390_13660 [Clostridium botulinum]
MIYDMTWCCTQNCKNKNKCLRSKHKEIKQGFKYISMAEFNCDENKDSYFIKDDRKGGL